MWSNMSSASNTVRIKTPTIDPPYPPLPPKMEVPPMTTAATEGRRNEAARLVSTPPS